MRAYLEDTVTVRCYGESRRTRDQRCHRRLAVGLPRRAVVTGDPLGDAVAAAGWAWTGGTIPPCEDFPLPEPLVYCAHCRTRRD